jgi:hypothetical protein
MSERQLQSRSMVTGVEIVSQVLESHRESRELDCNISENDSIRNKVNTQIETQIGGEEVQSPDDQVNSLDKSDDNTAMVSNHLQRFMERVMKSFDNLQSKIRSDNAKLVEKSFNKLQSKIRSDIAKLVENLNAKIEAENSRLVEQIESNNKRLSETLTKQFSMENEKLRAEFSIKLEGKVMKFQKDRDKLRSDTAIEILSVSNIMEGVCEKLDDRLTGHIEETDRCIDRVTEELKAKTKVLEIGLSRQVENTDSDIQSLRQELIKAKQQTNADVSDKISV